MPKTRRDRSVSFDGSTRSPFHCSSSLSNESKPNNPLLTVEDVKEWEDARCPVCMEHPHNAVLLICSSYHNGCRPYMCDTSYRHSNCLDQFRKSFTETSAEALLDSIQAPAESSEVLQDEGKSRGSIAAEVLSSMHKIQQKLVCPLCRGQISGWVVVDLARDFMNTKSRSCACETCEFTGTYANLRKHARSEHPQVRPSEADPVRQESWRDLERERDIGDVFSTFQSAFGDSQDVSSILPSDDRGWITIFFFFRVWRPPSSPTSTSPRRSSWSGTTRARTRAETSARRSARLLWGESYEGEPGSISNPVEVEEDSSDEVPGSVTWRRRVRRRLPTPDDEI